MYWRWHGANKPHSHGARLNRAHPLARGLEFAVIYGGPYGRDLVRGYNGLATANPSSTVVGERGVGAGLYMPGTSTNGYLTFAAAAKQQTTYIGNITLMWRGVFPAAFTGSKSLFNKCNAGGASMTPFEWRVTKGATYYFLECVRSGVSYETFGAHAAPGATVGVVQTLAMTLPADNATAATSYYGKTAVTNAAGTKAPYSDYVADGIQVGMRPDGAVKSINTVTLLTYAWSRILTAAEISALVDEPYAFIQPGIPMLWRSTGAQAIAMGAGTGAYAYTGAADGVALSYHQRNAALAMGSGAYAYTGAAAGVTLNYNPITSGDFTVGGESVEDLFETTGVSYTGAPLSRKTSTH